MIKNSSQLLIIGASGHGKVVADIAIKMKQWEYIAFLDDDSLLHKSMNIDVIGNCNDIRKFINEYEIFIASAIIGEQTVVGFGTVIMAGTVINCCCSIGKGCIINTGSTLDHDNVIDNYVHISPGVNIAGTVRIGKNSWIGIGSIIKNNISITSDCIVGAGAVVVSDIIESGTYIGVPARLMEV